MTRAETETVVRWDRETDIVIVSSSDRAVWGKLERAGFRSVRASTIRGEDAERRYEIPLAKFRWGIKGKPRVVSDEQRARARERMLLRSRPTPALERTN